MEERAHHAPKVTTTSAEPAPPNQHGWKPQKRSAKGEERALGGSSKNELRPLRGRRSNSQSCLATHGKAATTSRTSPATEPVTAGTATASDAVNGSCSSDTTDKATGSSIRSSSKRNRDLPEEAERPTADRWGMGRPRPGNQMHLQPPDPATRKQAHLPAPRNYPQPDGTLPDRRMPVRLRPRKRHPRRPNLNVPTS